MKILSISALMWVLSSCGGGGTTAGVGGSGIGGTGVTLVRGNVVTVTAALDLDRKGDGYARMLARIADLISREAVAQAGGVSGIRVSGGGKQDITDDLGRFDLIDVTPSSNFIITLVLSDGQRVDFSIGAVPDMAAVRVDNIVIDSGEGSAQPSSVEVKDNSDDDTEDGKSTGDSNSTDDTSSPQDDNSTGIDEPDEHDEPDEPDEPDSNSTDEVEPPEDGN